MTNPLPERADFNHLRHQAKALLDALHASTSEALDAVRAHDPSLVPTQAKLADAQRLVARGYGFPSWARLKAHVETPKLVERFRQHVETGEAEALDALLRKSRTMRERIDDPIFSFDSPAIVHAAGKRPIAEVLLRHGANPNVRTGWWAGGFGALDFASPEAADFLLAHGARLDVWSAAAQGRAEELIALLDANPEWVNAPGGDGMRPLHFASTVAVAQALLERGADPDLRDVDHESTATQYQIGRPEIARLLLAHGATPDVFLAAALNDAERMEELLARDPGAAEARVGEGEFVTRTSNGGHIYVYLLGSGRTPQQVAAERGNAAVLAVLEAHSSPARRLVAACWREDAIEVARLLAKHPGLAATLEPADARALPDAAGAGKLGVVNLMLEAGFAPTAPGLDQGTALHCAAWFGHAPVVERLAKVIDLSLRDGVHGSPPLGWAAHGARWCNNREGDYVRTVEALLAAGADVHAAANSGGTSMLDQAGGREDVKAVLRRYGAS